MRTYVRVSGVVFGAIALAHVLRLAFGWPAEIAGWVVPLWGSWIALLAAGALCAWAGFLLGRPER